MGKTLHLFWGLFLHWVGIFPCCMWIPWESICPLLCYFMCFWRSFIKSPYVHTACFPRCCRLSGLMLRVLTPLELSSVQGQRQGSSSPLVWWLPGFVAPFVGDVVFSPMCVWHACQTLGGCSLINFCVGPVFYPAGLHVSFCAISMLILLL